MKKNKLGLVLGSGGAKGLSHIGVIKVLEENNISVDFIAGSSIGALIGGVYASTKDVAAIEKVVLNTDWKKIFSLIDPAFKGGLLGGDKVKSFIKKYVGKENFEDLLIPLSVIATNLKDGAPVIYSKGDVVSAIRASISFPLLFRAVKIGDDVLADGGLSLPVPVSVVKEMGADVVLAVNLDGDYFNKDHQKTKTKFYNTANNSLNILRYHLAKHNSKEADLVILPKTGEIHWDKFVKGKDVIVSGEEAMREKINELKKILSS
jgi:NTE family protein